MHPILWLGYKFGGNEGLRKTVKILNGILLLDTKILGTKHVFSGKELLPNDRIIVFVSNHQSMYDVSPLEHYLSEFNPKFISKKQLGNGIPSVSRNLKLGKAALIDRNNPKQSIYEIQKLCAFVKENFYSIIIFPEGTRSGANQMNPFQASGLKTIKKYIPEALFVPVCIRNSWKITASGKLPLGVGNTIYVDVLPPYEKEVKDISELLVYLYTSIENKLITNNY